MTHGPEQPTRSHCLKKQSYCLPPRRHNAYLPGATVHCAKCAFANDRVELQLVVLYGHLQVCLNDNAALLWGKRISEQGLIIYAYIFRIEAY